MTFPSAVVVFGASGFIGRNIVDALSGRVETLIGVTSSSPNVPGCDRTVTIDRLGDVPALPVDTVVIHVAAYRYDASTFFQEQADILERNVGLAHSVYRFCTERGIKEVRLGSSVAVYPAAWPLQDDNRALDLNAPPHEGEAAYAWSKRWGEICADLYLRRFGVNTLIFRLSNPYGPYDSIDVKKCHVAPAFIIKALAPGDTFEILGNADAERDFVFAGDAARVFAASLRHQAQNDAFNLAFGSTIPIRQLAEAALLAAGRSDKKLVVGAAAPGINVRKATGDRVRKAFDVPSFVGLDDGLAKSMEWYRHALAQ